MLEAAFRPRGGVPTSFCGQHSRTALLLHTGIGFRFQSARAFCNKKLEEDRISSEMAMELKQVLSKLDAISAEELGASSLGSLSFQLDVSNINWSVWLEHRVSIQTL